MIKPALFLLMVIQLFSACNQIRSNDVNFISDTTKNKKSEAIQPKIGQRISGDFNGDGILENTSTKILKEGILEEEPFQLEINFSSDSIKSLPFSCDRNWIWLINEGDLNGIAGDELTVYSPPNHGCTYAMTTFTFVNKNWKQLMEMFLVPTFCDEMSDEDLQKRIFIEGNDVYYFETNFDGDSTRLVKTKAVIK